MRARSLGGRFCAGRGRRKDSFEQIACQGGPVFATMSGLMGLSVSFRRDVDLSFQMESGATSDEKKIKAGGTAREKQTDQGV